jgi:hypothetical protein
MSKKSFDVLFRKDMAVLERAVYRAVDLDYEYPKLYKKVKKYFQQQEEIEFYDEPEADYEEILSLIREKLKLDIPA